MKDLIERLESVPGPDRELDSAIWLSMGGSIKGGVAGTRWIDWNGVLCTSPYPWTYFTSSTDAALTLAPEPTVEGDKGKHVQCVFDFGRRFFSATVNFDHHATGSTAANAIAAAALKARLRSPAGTKEQP